MDATPLAPESAKAEFQSIPVDQIKPSQHQARKAFDEESIKGLAESMKQETLLQPISVRKAGDGYELISGERRLRAAKLLGWTAIDAKVIQTVSEGEAAAKGLVENLQREDLNPVEEAEGFAELSRLDPGYWTQDKIGQVAGKSQTYVSRSAGLLGLPDVIKENMRRRIISRDHGIELLRLSDSAKQSQLAKEIVSKDLSRGETRKRVDSMTGDTKGNKPAKAPPDSPADPLADLWETAQSKLDFAVGGPWEVSFSRKGWNILVAPQTSLKVAALAVWLKRMAEAVAAKADPKEIESIENELRQVSTEGLPSGNGACLPAGRAVPDSGRPGWPLFNEKEFDQIEEDQKNIRLPKTPEEQAELEALAAKSSGPGPIYAWIMGPNSLMAKKMQSVSWTDVHITDPVAGCRQLIEGLKMLQS